MIEFLCPNGHHIHCPDEQAGRAAKCPKCGVRFRIPRAEEATATQAAGGSADTSPAQLTDSGVVTPPPSRGGESQIEFLCPNGHRLHGPASLQGRPGQCPECDSKFRIPSYDEVTEDEEAEQELGIGRADGREGSGVSLQRTDIVDVAELEPIEEFPHVEEIPMATPPHGSPGAAGRHPMAALVDRLWPQRSQAAGFELHLNGGDTLVPDRFAKDLSREHYGLFAVKESDGTHTLTAVAWDSVAHVVLLGVEKLPPELAE